MQPDDLDYQLLSQIANQQNANQRDLASRLGVSVGKVNYCLRAVVDRGWVKVNNFRRADNKWAYAYVLTPGGASAKLQLARAFLERKEREFEQLQDEISMLRGEVSQDQTAE
ncbi:MarR family EPS-associated transcriptional regulator [Paucibacter sp. B2R-40]|uniref:MarR family EPS-associated transcriptional regulator n=1 Tax=Paucibacter sp. B2R-40 TaxID=2893554 RepID=UPI0021E4AA26|nr:MarR family EPS-associated transcriptional regulator [Paucibacter sp. B2R-40]MCV2354517.1 MarR family EPS-associated transcriptional regulator [Paucibacter sp. B2R-40]